MSVPAFDTIEQEVRHLREQVKELFRHNNEALQSNRELRAEVARLNQELQILQGGEK